MGSEPREVRFRAFEYTAEDTFVERTFLFRGSLERGWEIERDGEHHLRLGPGYRLLATEQCGVCSTDLDRRFLPFPLPQITGHELVARDTDGRRFVVEINASHQARGIETPCPLCSAGLATHCPDRLVLGIHALPGGFGPWVLVPDHAAIELPESIPIEVAALCEPFAAALHGARRMALKAGESVAVLGPRRLGLLCVAALRAEADARGIEIDLVAVSRHRDLLERAGRFGAARGVYFEGSGEELVGAAFDRVVDTTGSPEGLELALRLARNEVHLKSTHGRASGGLKHTTELVVDEFTIRPLPRNVAEAHELAQLGSGERTQILWLASEAPAGELIELCELSFGERPEDHFPSPPGYDAVVVEDEAAADLAIRPNDGEARSLLRPRGHLFVHPSAAHADSTLLRACATRGLVLSTSRCGDFRAAIELLQNDASLRSRLAELITHRFPAAELPRAFEAARSKDCIKALVRHP